MADGPTPPDKIAVPPEPGKGQQGLALLFGLLGMVVFAGTLPALRLALEGFDPFFITAGRAVLAGVIALVVVAVTRVPRPRGKDAVRLGVLSLFLVLGFPLLTGIALLTVGASHGGIVLAINPIATAIAATIVGQERPGLMFWLFSALGAAIVGGFMLSQGGGRFQPGDLVLVAAAFVAGFGYALSGRLSRRMPGWTVIAWALIISLPVSTLGAVMWAPTHWPTALTPWLGFAYLGAFSMFLGFVFWNRAMAVGGIARIGQLQLLQPFVTTGLATTVAGEAFNIEHLPFAAAVVLVVAAALRARVRPATSHQANG
ncbi:MAG: DMT family transporter [Pseudomonadota bacterium]